MRSASPNIFSSGIHTVVIFLYSRFGTAPQACQISALRSFERRSLMSAKDDVERARILRLDIREIS